MKKGTRLPSAASASRIEVVKDALLCWRSPALLLSLLLPMAAATTLQSGLALGLVASIALLFCNTLLALTRGLLPARFLKLSYCFAVVAAISILDLLVQAFLPAVSDSLGISLPLLCLNLLFLLRGPDHTDSPLPAALGALASGAGFTVLLSLVSAVRELLGSGTLWGVQLFRADFPNALLLRAAPGGLLLLACLIAAAQWRAARRGEGDA